MVALTLLLVLRGSLALPPIGLMSVKNSPRMSKSALIHLTADIIYIKSARKEGVFWVHVVHLDQMVITQCIPIVRVRARKRIAITPPHFHSKIVLARVSRAVLICPIPSPPGRALEPLLLAGHPGSDWTAIPSTHTPRAPILRGRLTHLS